MIYITQGHEKGIGLEVFLKSFFLLTKLQRKKITLIANLQTLNDNLKFLGLSKKSIFDLNLIEIIKNKTPLSTSSLEKALELVGEKDILITLPTSKDQLFFKEESCAGYTEYFRKRYQNIFMSMNFMAPMKNVLLLTDHLSLKEVSEKVTSDLFVNKVSLSIDNHQKYFTKPIEVIISGINPHAGENGILGSEEEKLKIGLKILKDKYPEISFKGPLPGDTLHNHEDHTKKQLFVYCHHDQGLALFKGTHGFIGNNITMGLPFLRMSVDHGTAFDLYSKNMANAQGSYYLLQTALKVAKRIT